MKSNPIVETFSQMTPSREFEQVMVEFDNNIMRYKEVSLKIQRDEYSMPMKIQNICINGSEKMSQILKLDQNQARCLDYVAKHNPKNVMVVGYHGTGKTSIATEVVKIKVDAFERQNGKDLNVLVIADIKESSGELLNDLKTRHFCFIDEKINKLSIQLKFTTLCQAYENYSLFSDKDSQTSQILSSSTDNKLSKGNEPAIDKQLESLLNKVGEDNPTTFNIVMVDNFKIENSVFENLMVSDIKEYWQIKSPENVHLVLTVQANKWTYDLSQNLFGKDEAMVFSLHKIHRNSPSVTNLAKGIHATGASNIHYSVTPKANRPLWIHAKSVKKDHLFVFSLLQSTLSHCKDVVWTCFDEHENINFQKACDASWKFSKFTNLDGTELQNLIIFGLPEEPELLSKLIFRAKKTITLVTEQVKMW